MSSIQNVVAKNVCLSEIKGVHKIINDLDACLSIPPLGSINPKIIDKYILQNLLKNAPIRVIKYKTDYYCIGNIRLYKMIKAKLLDGDEPIPVLEQTNRINKKQLQQEYLSELFYMPAIFGLITDDINRLFQISKRLFDNNELPKVGHSTQIHFEKLYRLNPGRLRKHATHSTKKK